MARPAFPAQIHTVRLSLRLREGQHDDLIAFFQAVPERGRAAAVVAALRQGGVTAVLPTHVIDEMEVTDVLDAMMF